MSQSSGRPHQVQSVAYGKIERDAVKERGRGAGIEWIVPYPFTGKLEITEGLAEWEVMM
jgi:hypothetical protein